MALTAQQKATLGAIAFAFVAPLSKDAAAAVVSAHLNDVDDSSAVKSKELEAFAQMPPPDLGVVDAIESKLNFFPADKKYEFVKVLDVLATSWGTYLLTGSKRIVPFHDLTLDEREHALLNLSQSRFALLRSLFRALKALTHLCTFAQHVTNDTGDVNPYWKALQYAGKPTEKALPPRSHFHEPCFEDVAALAEAANGGPIEIDTDVVVVGSGAGGGVIAAELAQAGHRVVVLEQGTFHHPSDSNFAEMEEYEKHYIDSVFLVSEDGSMQLLAGKTWGGGTAVNWSASLRPPSDVLDEWVKKHNLPYFGTPEYQAALNAVCTRAGVSADHVSHNVPNQILVDGCAALEFPAHAIPQNTNGHRHSCGFCSLGCPYGEKQGTHMTWLQDAEAAGAKFITGCKVDKVTFTADKIATGVVGTVLDGNVSIVVRANTVVTACGGVNSPALLLRSGLGNPNIGRNMRLHPVTTVHGFLPDKLVKSWEGSIMTSVTDVVSNVHGDGYVLNTVGALLALELGMVLVWKPPRRCWVLRRRCCRGAVSQTLRGSCCKFPISRGS
ncbi:hypothetical protein, variant 3 [Aphanomyces invadans]|uniref:Uncharacterized protein n=1 Tax=Aphanomyces invadans TaxID=157072 RepID=A0A024U1A9_9STRA|nr:hypothetical protein, variant 2 [Aphanomyces invadans]XP_008871241.1 hypothetical protein, variant 3 [Aphanomyces invadans]ETW00215.1 hypothetical protein, variant 2 [Aphanomyces invadans]ETW00216.1 hypothetical protein, variant 3 [Aphanomyces invadans]|eukprot:XP_008871240.1 hypothetical protein, variant 2 [Aphanomyces invadans]